MSRRKRSLPPPSSLVSVPLLFTRKELHALDFMASALCLDRSRLVRCALGLLTVAGPFVASAIHQGDPVSVCLDVPGVADL